MFIREIRKDSRDPRFKMLRDPQSAMAVRDKASARVRNTMKASTLLASAMTLLASMSCDSDNLGVTGDSLSAGTWGGEDVSVQVEQELVHVHVGCTNGDFPAPLVVDANGRINVAGSYVLRAYPIQVGPSLPAQLAGILSGRQLTFTIAVNDTVEKKLVVLGPVTVTFGREPKMGPCPICTVEMRAAKAAGLPNALTRGRSRTRSAG